MTSTENMPPWLSADEVAARFRVSKATVYRWSRDGTLPKQRSMGPRASRWSGAEIAEYEASRLQSS